MSETKTPTESPDSSPLPIHPSDILISLIVALLAPMFLTSANGDITFARLAALETISVYRARNQADLIVIAQAVAFGLAALGSLSLSMLDGLSPKMILQFRGNATACHRCAEQSRRILSEQPAPEQPAPEQPVNENDAAQEEAVAAQVAETEKRIAYLRGKPAAPPAKTELDPHQAAWATAMSTVAGEYIAAMPHLSPEERKAATIRAAALSQTVNHLLSGAPAQPLRPGDRPV